jgi:DNA adenine methylase
MAAGPAACSAIPGTLDLRLGVWRGASEFAHKPPSRREIFNDIDNNVYSVFAVLRDEPQCQQLLSLLENSHDSRRLYFECFAKLLQENLTTIDRAYCFLIIGNSGFQARHPLLCPSYASGLAKKARRLVRLPDILPAWRERMRLVECENYDAFDLIDLYDGPHTFFFLDPPFHESTCRQDLYVHAQFDHRRFLRRLQDLEGMALVCGYPHGLYDVQLLGWRRVSFAVAKRIGGWQPRTQLIWMNYDEMGNKLSQDLKLIRAFERLPA